jgi:pimeloyl-ACP methyl ester carboxylesterase
MNLVGKPLLAAIFACLAGTAVAQSPGPQGGEVGPRREQEWRIPAPGGSPLMVATVMRPPGEAKAPLVVINHGSPADRTLRPKMERPHFVTLSSFFVARGYVVAMPLRRGYGATGGRWAEDFGRCDNPDYFGSGLATAADIKATVDYMLTQPFVAPGRTIVVGHSAGGWGALALSSLNPPGIPAMIDFSGGLGGHAPGVGNCSPSALVKAAGRYGATARMPVLWISAENDTFFDPKLVQSMVDAYDGAGGRATYRPVGPFGTDGHSLATTATGGPIWQPLVEQFLQGK